MDPPDSAYPQLDVLEPEPAVEPVIIEPIQEVAAEPTVDPDPTPPVEPQLVQQEKAPVQTRSGRTVCSRQILDLQGGRRGRKGESKQNVGEEQASELNFNISEFSHRPHSTLKKYLTPPV